MPSKLMDSIFGYFDTPDAAMAAGLLSPTQYGTFGEGILQGMQASGAKRRSDNLSMLSMSEEAIRQQQLKDLERAAAERKARQQYIGAPPTQFRPDMFPGENPSMLSGQNTQGMMNRGSGILAEGNPTPAQVAGMLAHGGANEVMAYSQMQNSMKPPAPKNPTEASLSLACENGDKVACAALKRLQDNRASSLVTVNSPFETKFSQKAGELDAEDLYENRGKARTYNDAIRVANNSYSLASSGNVITGKFADLRLQLAKMAKAAGFDDNGSIPATEAFMMSQGNAVLEIMASGALGAGTGLSDADREFAKGVVGGSIELDDMAILKVLQMNAAANEWRVKRHNAEVRKLKPTSTFSQSQIDRLLVPEVKYTGLPVALNQKQIDALPKGTTFWWKDGTKRMKK